MQVSEAFHRYGTPLGARVVPVYGGAPIGRQLAALRYGADVVVATPGRALDLLGRGSLDLSGLSVVVLDEADEMLDMGFAEDLDAILDAAPQGRQTLLFSATIPRRIRSLAERHLTDPVRVQIKAAERSEGEAPQVRQVVYTVARPYKALALARVLNAEAPEATLVFCRTRTEVDSLTETLNARGYRAEALHGGLAQEARDRVMGRLRTGTAELLVATDVAARGLDVDLLTHVVNYDVPSAPESYVHRVGRVGRAGREGVAITLAEPREQRMLATIERVTGRTLDRRPLPSVEDVQARRRAATQAALRDVLTDRADELARLRPLVEAMTEEHEAADVAAAALVLAADADRTPTDDEEIPAAPTRKERDRDRDRERERHGYLPDRGTGGQGGPRGGRPDGPAGARGERPVARQGAGLGGPGPGGVGASAGPRRGHHRGDVAVGP